MTKRQLSAVKHESPVTSEPEVPELQPNDAFILKLLARYPTLTGDQKERLLSMLSSEGATIAHALLGTETPFPLSEAVVKTANSLRDWARTPSRLSKGSKPPRAQSKDDSARKAEKVAESQSEPALA